MQVRAWLGEQKESVVTVQGQCSAAATCVHQCRIEAPSELVAGSTRSPSHVNLIATSAAGLKQGCVKQGFVACWTEAGLRHAADERAGRCTSCMLQPPGVLQLGEADNTTPKCLLCE
jgi:hypothetical protein